MAGIFSQPILTERLLLYPIDTYEHIPRILLLVQYPHLIHGAIASSAVVRAVLDNKGYNDIVAKSLADLIVGGSAQVNS